LEAPSGHGVRRIVFAVAVLAAIFVLTLLAEQPPAEKPASAGTTEFSAARARNHAIISASDIGPGKSSARASRKGAGIEANKLSMDSAPTLANIASRSEGLFGR